MVNALILTAAGSSSRMGGPVKKEYLPFSGESGVSVISACLHAFLSTSLFSLIVITVPEGGEAEAREVLARDNRIPPLPWEGVDVPRLVFVPGGNTRQASILRGLGAIESSGGPGNGRPQTVLVHDAARPWITGAVIRRVLDAVALHGAAVPGVTPVDTQKEIDETGRIVRHLERARLSAVQTPQGFRFGELLEAHRQAASDGREYTDDTEIWGRYVGDVYACEGDPANRKITYREDLR